MPCQNCKKSDQPEWILLCDTCNQGWHASCLRPPLMVIPDGDWYCPTCRHSSLLDSLKEVLKKYDEESKKRENEELRRKRLAYVGISLQNVISSKTEEVKTPKLPTVHDSSEEDEEESESESYDSEPLYQLRARRQTNVSYRFNDYDDMINEAILEETGVNESVTKKSIEAKADKNDNDENTDSENVDDNKNRDDSPIAPALLHLRGRKKSKKLTNLDISSDDGSDEDFKGPSDGDDDYEEEFSEYSDDSVQNRAQPTRRSVRNRKTVVDPDFINDDSSEDGDKRPNKKRSRPWSESSNSEGEDFTWGKRKNKRANIPSSSSLSFKSHKGSKRQRNSNDSVQKSKKYKIKYGMESDSDSYGQSKRRTRGRQITYAESDESEEEVQTKKRKVMSDEEDEYVLNDEELAAENDDHHLEVDEEDAMASNDEKDDDEDAEEEEEEGEEEEEEEEVADEEEGDDEEQKVSDSKPAAVQQVAEKLPTSAAAAVAQSVIRELPPPPLVSTVPPTAAADYAQQRLLPLAAGATTVRTSVLAPTPLPPVDPADKRKRPSPHQLNESPLPNPSVDYGGGGYPYPSDATKVVASTVVPPSQPVHQAAFNRPPVVAAAVGAAGFKPMAGVPPPGYFPAQYRVPNKMAPTGYVAPQVRQLYQSVPPPPQQSRATYSQYPIDYAATGTPLPSPLPPTVSFRNVVVAPPPSHEHLPMQPLPPPVTQQQSVVISGDSEFGGLVSYFSSQQEDDFDT
uniref:Bromodomain adjacent to zinc finger domain protein 2B n=1 Tax=Sipha flava TaxID=143950 RepID=A0A2S2QG69_9HEMI